ncbi:MAG: DUF4783 domain-containing protein [Bacteroidota bacterium]
MKNLVSISKVLLLALLFSGMSLSIRAQSPKVTFQKIATMIGQGQAGELAKHFNSTVELTLPTSDKTYSAQQAGFVLKEFFATRAPKAYKIVHTGHSGQTHYQTGTLSTSKGVYDANIFLKKVGDKYLITQLTFEEE